MAVRVHPEVAEGGERTGHQPLAAGLVDDAGALVEDGDVEPLTGGVQGGREPRRAATHHDQVLHVDAGAGRVLSAAFSVRIRTVSSAALSTVKTTAVTQAEWTSGRANPSTTTAT